MKTHLFVRKLSQKIFSPPLGLLGLAVLAYGIFLPWMGFYWDDWPWMWRYHVYGAQAIREIDVAFRPLAGIVLWGGAQLAGENPLGWQIYNLAIRWLGGMAFWWALRQIWPERKQAAFWIACIFLVYPGFGHQFVAVNSSRHLFPLILFFLSFGLTGTAVHKQKLFGWQTWAAAALSLITMLTTEYFYGLELIRAAVLWMSIKPEEGSPLQRIKTSLKAWLPYLLPLVVVFTWRYAVSQEINYSVGIVERFLAAPGRTLLDILATTLKDFFEVTLLAWKKFFEFPNPGEFGPRRTLLFWGVFLISGAGIAWVAWLLPREPRDRRWNFQAMMIGAAAILISGLPFWATDLDVGLGFPSDRLTLPMMAGVSLLAVGLIDWLAKPRLARISILALMVALSVGVQVRNAVSYQEDWKDQVAFFQQLIWRVPVLKSGTAILTTELPLRYVTDNSLTGPLNWIYGPETPTARMGAAIFYLDERLGGKVSALEEGAPITLPGDEYPFESSTSNSLVLYHAPPACVRVLDPEYDRHLPAMSRDIEKALPFSNLAQIVPETGRPATLPEHIFGLIPTGSWCYYFEKADLARQQGDWEGVAEIGDVAFQLADSPNHASERVPFIEGYAHVSEWETAVDLTMEAIEINRFMKNMLCDTWARIDRDIPASASKAEAVQKIEARLTCKAE